jgi:hypothetical protein
MPPSPLATKSLGATVSGWASTPSTYTLSGPGLSVTSTVPLGNHAMSHGLSRPEIKGVTSRRETVPPPPDPAVPPNAPLPPVPAQQLVPADSPHAPNRTAQTKKILNPTTTISSASGPSSSRAKAPAGQCSESAYAKGGHYIQKRRFQQAVLTSVQLRRSILSWTTRRSLMR